MYQNPGFASPSFKPALTGLSYRAPPQFGKLRYGSLSKYPRFPRSDIAVRVRKNNAPGTSAKTRSSTSFHGLS